MISCYYSQCYSLPLVMAVCIFSQSPCLIEETLSTQYILYLTLVLTSLICSIIVLLLFSSSPDTYILYLFLSITVISIFVIGSHYIIAMFILIFGILMIGDDV